MSSIRVLMPSNSTNESFLAKNNTSPAKELVIRRPGVATTTIQTDWMCKRISHFTVSREIRLIGFGLYNDVNQNCYYGYKEDVGAEQINVEISIAEFKSGKVLYQSVAALSPNKASSVQRVFFKKPVVLKPGPLYEAVAYYDHFVPLYLKSDPFLHVQRVGNKTVGDLTIDFHQMLPKGQYQPDCYPSEIPELIFE